MSLNGMRLGIAGLVAGGALTGGLLFGGALVSAQTPDDTPAAEETAPPADSTTPSVTPDGSETPSTSTEGPPSDSEKNGRDGGCDKDGDGQPDGSTGLRSAGSRGDLLVQ